MARVIADEQIVEAALQVMLAQGYAGATTRAIAAAAGINEGTRFRRFGSKENLLKAVVEEQARRFSAAGITYTGDVAADLGQVVQFYEELMQSRGRVIAMLIHEIPLQPELVTLMQSPFHIFTQIAALIERYQNEGVLVKEPPMQAFVALVGPLFLAHVLGSLQPQMFGTSFDTTGQVNRFLQGRQLV